MPTTFEFEHINNVLDEDHNVLAVVFVDKYGVRTHGASIGVSRFVTTSGVAKQLRRLADKLEEGRYHE